MPPPIETKCKDDIFCLICLQIHLLNYPLFIFIFAVRREKILFSLLSFFIYFYVMQINMLKNRFTDVNRSENKVAHALIKN
jgi:hypothetical protein